MRYLIFLFFITACESTKKDHFPLVQEKYKIVEGSFWTTSKAGTVLTVKTMFKINIETGETSYLNEGVWYKIQ